MSPCINHSKSGRARRSCMHACLQKKAFFRWCKGLGSTLLKKDCSEAVLILILIPILSGFASSGANVKTLTFVGLLVHSFWKAKHCLWGKMLVPSSKNWVKSPKIAKSISICMCVCSNGLSPIWRDSNPDLVFPRRKRQLLPQAEHVLGSGRAMTFH
jgi:hypothetical protein